MIGFNETLSLCVQDLEEETCLLIYSFVQTTDAVIPGLIDLDISNEKLNDGLRTTLEKLTLDDTTYPGPFPLLSAIALSQSSILQNQKRIHPTFNPHISGF